MNVWLRRALHALGWSFAVVVISAALAFAVARQFVHEARPWVEEWAERQLGQPVRVGEIDLALVRGRPALALSDVTLLDEQAAPLLSFSRLQLQIALVESLLNLGWRSDALIVDGLVLSATRSPFGGLRVNIVPGASGRGEAAQAWLLAQSRVELREARVDWDGEPALRDVSLALRRVGRAHRLEGRARLPGGGRFKLALDLATAHAPRDPAAWRAQGEMHAQGVALNGLAQALALPGEPRGRAGLDLRLQAEGGVLSMQGEADLRQLGVRRRLVWPALEGGVSGQLSSAGWSLETTLHGPRQQGADVPLSLRAEGDSSGVRLSVPRLESSEVHALGQALSAVLEGTGVARYLEGAAPRAELSDLEAARDEHGRWAFTGAFAALGQREWRAAPAVSGAAGSFRFGPDGGAVQLHAHAAALTFPRLFREPLRLDRIEGPLVFRKDAQGWRIDAQQVAVSNAHAAATLSGSLRPTFDGAPAHLDLRVAVERADARFAPHYVPAHIMPEKAVAWLDQAFRAGHVREGEVIYEGLLSGFPPSEGRFEARLSVTGVTLDYDPEWPQLSDVDGELEFVGRSLRVRRARGRMLDSTVTQAQAHIEDLSAPLLVMDARAEGPLQDLLRVARETPLRKAMRYANAEAFSVDGRSALALQLTLPLSAAARAQQAPQWAGAVELHEARVAHGELAVEDLTGRVRFAQRAVNAQNLAGRLWDAPVRGELQSAEDGTLRAKLEGDLAPMALTWLGLPDDLLAGSTRWNGTLAVDAGGAWTAHAASTLQGLVVALPEPFGKEMDESRPMRLSAAGAPDKHATVTLRYGPHAGRAQVREKRVEGAALALGGGQGEQEVGNFGLPELVPGEVRVRGRLERLALRGWPQLGTSGMSDRRESHARGGIADLRWDIDLDRLGLVVGHDASASAAEEAPDAAPAPPRARPESAFDPGAVPEAEVRVGALSYDDAELGELQARLTRRPHGVELTALSLRGGALYADARAEWLRGPMGETFSLTGNMQTQSLAALSGTLGFGAGLDARRTRVEGSLFWVGSPWRPTPATLHGTLRLDLRDGALREVEPGAGRLVGLLGISALPRRLRLDFRDVFYEGYRFDNALGSVRFAGGSAVTEDFRMNGPAARVRASGRADLIAREYDHEVVVAPRVGQAAPLAGALAWGPQVGAVILIAQQLFRERFDQSISARYRVTGPWHAPDIESQGMGPKEAADLYADE